MSDNKTQEERWIASMTRGDGSGERCPLHYWIYMRDKTTPTHLAITKEKKKSVAAAKSDGLPRMRLCASPDLPPETDNNVVLRGLGNLGWGRRRLR